LRELIARKAERGAFLNDKGIEVMDLRRREREGVADTQVMELRRKPAQRLGGSGASLIGSTSVPVGTGMPSSSVV
jgi:hypothetical protein